MTAATKAGRTESAKVEKLAVLKAARKAEKMVV